jgi:hypothetical protein
LAKTGGEKRQWNILKSVGVPEDEIHLFSQAKHWLQYFPPIAVVSIYITENRISSFYGKTIYTHLLNTMAKL